jgi:hypothetical protein
VKGKIKLEAVERGILLFSECDSDAGSFDDTGRQKNALKRSYGERDLEGVVWMPTAASTEGNEVERRKNGWRVEWKITNVGD